MKVNAARLRADLERLGEFGREPDGAVTRPAFSDADLAARQWFASRASDAGLPVVIDGVWNVIVGDADGSQPAVWTGSHLDSVPKGGMFDGAVGAIAALECVRRIHEERIRLRRPVRAVAFSDEEGAFYGFLGSKALAVGVTEAEINAASGRDGLRLIEALRGSGRDPAEYPRVVLGGSTIHSFVELHVEQGPELEANEVDIGVVSTIVGVCRADISFGGRPDHAGTTPMHKRRDPVRGAAAFLERLPEIPAKSGRRHGVVTCGRFTLEPGADNVVPSAAIVHLDFRDSTADGLDQLVRQLQREAEACAARYGLDMKFQRTSTTSPAHVAEDLAALIERTAQELGFSTRTMTSGAGHDAQVMAALAPIGMIFVPSRDGRSHSRWEYTSWEDIERGANVLLGTLLKAAEAEGSEPEGPGREATTATRPTA